MRQKLKRGGEPGEWEVDPHGEVGHLVIVKAPGPKNTLEVLARQIH
jgi:hypothetical protein